MATKSVALSWGEPFGDDFHAFLPGHYPEHADQALAVFLSNTAMQANDATDHRLTDLEIKASFNEDLLEQLNQVVVRQQQQIDALVHQVAQLRRQIPEAGSGGFSRAGDDLPPHY
jgi:SlyX protein